MEIKEITEEEYVKLFVLRCVFNKVGNFKIKDLSDSAKALCNKTGLKISASTFLDKDLPRLEEKIVAGIIKSNCNCATHIGYDKEVVSVQKDEESANRDWLMLNDSKQQLSYQIFDSYKETVNKSTDLKK